MEIKELIKKAGYTQKAFAEKVEKSEIYIKKVCSGERKTQKWMVLLLENEIKLKDMDEERGGGLWR